MCSLDTQLVTGRTWDLHVRHIITVLPVSLLFTMTLLVGYNEGISSRQSWLWWRIHHGEHSCGVPLEIHSKCAPPCKGLAAVCVDLYGFMIFIDLCWLTFALYSVAWMLSISLCCRGSGGVTSELARQEPCVFVSMSANILWACCRPGDGQVFCLFVFFLFCISEALYIPPCSGF